MIGLLFVRILMFTNGALYLFSFTTNQKFLDSKFRAAVQFYLCSALINFGQVHGFPKFTKEYLQKTMTDPAVQRIFGGMLLLMGSNFMALLALLLVRGGNVGGAWWMVGSGSWPTSYPLFTSTSHLSLTSTSLHTSPSPSP